MSTDTASTEVNWPNWQSLFDQKPYVLLVSQQSQRQEFVHAVEQVLNEVSDSIQVRQETTLADEHGEDAEHRHAKLAGPVSFAIDVTALTASQPGHTRLSSQAIKAMAQIAVKQALAEHSWRKPGDKKQNSIQESFDEWVYRARAQVLLVEQEQALDDLLQKTAFRNNFSSVETNVDTTHDIAGHLPLEEVPLKGKVVLGELKLVDPPQSQKLASQKQEPIVQNPTKTTLYSDEGNSGNSGSSGGEGQGGGRLQSVKPRLRLEPAEQIHHKPVSPDMRKSPEHPPEEHKPNFHKKTSLTYHHIQPEKEVVRPKVLSEGEQVQMKKAFDQELTRQEQQEKGRNLSRHGSQRMNIGQVDEKSRAAGVDRVTNTDMDKDGKITNSETKFYVTYPEKVVVIDDKFPHIKRDAGNLHIRQTGPHKPLVDIRDLPVKEQVTVARDAAKANEKIQNTEIADRILHSKPEITQQEMLTLKHALGEEKAKQLSSLAKQVEHLPEAQKLPVLQAIANSHNHSEQQKHLVEPAVQTGNNATSEPK